MVVTPQSLSPILELRKSTNKVFGERDKFEFEIKELLSLYSLEDLFDVLDIPPEEVLGILFNGGHCIVPDFLNREDVDDSD